MTKVFANDLVVANGPCARPAVPKTEAALVKPIAAHQQARGFAAARWPEARRGPACLMRAQRGAAAAPPPAPATRPRRGWARTERPGGGRAGPRASARLPDNWSGWRRGPLARLPRKARARRPAGQARAVGRSRLWQGLGGAARARWPGRRGSPPRARRNSQAEFARASARRARVVRGAAPAPASGYGQGAQLLTPASAEPKPSFCRGVSCLPVP